MNSTKVIGVIMVFAAVASMFLYAAFGVRWWHEMAVDDILRGVVLAAAHIIAVIGGGLCLTVD